MHFMHPLRSATRLTVTPTTAVHLLEVNETLVMVKVLGGVVPKEELAESVALPRGPRVLEGRVGHVGLQAQLLILALWIRTSK